MEGFSDDPEGATAAAPLEIPEDEDLTTPTGNNEPAGAFTKVEKDPELKRELELAEQLRAAEERANAAEKELAELRESTPMDLEGANELGGLGPASQVDPAEHRAAQARYRALRQQQLMAGNPEPEAPEVPEIELESPEERAERVREEAKAEYERRVAEMDPSEPVYVVGPRPPRPKVAGHTLAIGDVVPGAAYFTRLESWVGTGILIKQER